MMLISLIDANDGSGKTLEQTLGLSTTVTNSEPASFAPTSVRGGICISPSTLPSNPTPGTFVIDSNDNNTLKWWNGSIWVSAGA